jgi:translation initiation factor 5B
MECSSEMTVLYCRVSMVKCNNPINLLIGPIVTKVKAILTPHPMKEMRVKGEYIHHEILYASMGLKISANDLEEAVAGSQLYVVDDDEKLQHATTLLQNDFDAVKNKIKLVNMGVGVAASTLGSLEALLEFLRTSDIPVSYVSVGPVSKDDVMKALKNVVLEDPNKRKKE